VQNVIESLRPKRYSWTHRQPAIAYPAMLQLSLNFLEKQLNRLKPTRSTRTRSNRSMTWKNGLLVHLVFRPRARRYLLRLQPDGAARLVIPRGGSEAEGLRFLERSEAWLLKRRSQWQSRASHRTWADGARFLYRGEEVELRVEKSGDGVTLRFGDQSITVPHPQADYREAVSGHLRALATRELPVRTSELAALHRIAIGRISVRGQKTRWGSCSARGAISLNWKLIHAPAHVLDYLIIHELMHRREMNHSSRYWKLVAQACPDYRRAEQWLKGTRLETMD
jgi:predicted metal-dependent hydrolase